MLRIFFSITVIITAAITAVPQNPEQRPHPIFDPDSFTFTSLNQARPILDSFARTLLAEQEMEGHVIVYGGRTSCQGEAQQVLGLIKGYLVRRHNINERRIITVDGGYRERTTYEIWRVRTGLAGPEPVPTIDPRAVQFLRVNHPRCRSLRAATRNRRRA